MKKKPVNMIYCITLYFISASLTIAQPIVDLIQPAFGGFGSTIIINGSDFSVNDVDNTVFFGGLEANILNATENELMVTVPYGAYYTPISVYTNGLYTSSSQRFNVTFDAEEELTVSHLSNQLDNPYLGSNYYDIKIADLNGDGIPEIVTSEAGYYSSAYLTTICESPFKYHWKFKIIEMKPDNNEWDMLIGIFNINSGSPKTNDYFTWSWRFI